MEVCINFVISHGDEKYETFAPAFSYVPLVTDRAHKGRELAQKFPLVYILRCEECWLAAA